MNVKQINLRSYERFLFSVESFIHSQISEKHLTKEEVDLLIKVELNNINVKREKLNSILDKLDNTEINLEL